MRSLIAVVGAEGSVVAVDAQHALILADVQSVVSRDTPIIFQRFSAHRFLVERRHGDVADFAVVAVNGGTGPWPHIVDLTGAGVTREIITTIDPTRSHARIVFSGAAADPLPGSTGPDSIRTLLD